MSLSRRHDDSRMTLLYLIARELNQTLDLDQILRRVLIATVRVAGATDGSFFVFDDHDRLEKSLFAHGAKIIAVEKKVVRHLLEKGLAGWVKTHRQPALIPDVTRDERWYADPSNPDLLLHQSALSVPLLSGEKVLGVLTITHENPNYFDADDMALLSAVAEQAAIAIANARRYQTEQRRREMFATLNDLFRRMNVAETPEQLFALTLDRLPHLLTSDQRALFLLQEGEFLCVAARGIDNLAELQNLPVKFYKDDFALPLVREHIPCRTADLPARNTWFRDVVHPAARHWLGVPLIAGDALVGILSVAHSQRQPYTEEDEYILETLAAQAASAIKTTTLLNRLQEIQRRYTRLFEGSSDLLLILTPEGVITDANRKACQVFRRPKDVLVGSHLALVDPNLRDEFNTQRAELALGREITTDLTVRDSYGREVVLEVTAKQTIIDGQPAIQWAGRDVTARQELARLRRDFINMIVHDLRGPMGTLLGTVQMLAMVLDDIPDESLKGEAQGLLEIANRSGQYLKDLIDSVLDLSRLEQGETLISRTPVSLHALLREVEDQTRPQAEMKDLHIDFRSPPGDRTIEVDHSMIRRVLVNLVDNAIKYTPSGGQITVEGTFDDHTLTMTVTDTGPGIEKEKQKMLFDKFTRATTDAAIQGVGLGLAFCKMAVEAHGGKIWLESTVGVGSRFGFTIPCDAAGGENNA
ncbi:MAG: GAF domain-containing protein [Caldilineae bacterium]|nr:MAG: GAF domain-containing protein [Caldilineae bacterium]